MPQVLLRTRNERPPVAVRSAHAVVDDRVASCMNVTARTVRKVEPRRRGIPFAPSAMMLALATSTTGCRVVEGIFKTGFWFGVIAVVAVIAIVLFAIGKLVS